MFYTELLRHSYEVERSHGECGPKSRLEYLADYIFGFTTYDSGMSKLLAGKALEVCAAICNKQTFAYIENADNYQWYIIMCNMPFFAGRLDWGTSIRGAWWSLDDTSFESTGLWNGATQIYREMIFTHDQWDEFVRDVIEFGSEAEPPQPE